MKKTTPRGAVRVRRSAIAARTASAETPPIIRVKARSALDRQTKAIVGKPSREAFRLLDEGKLRGTIAEVELKMLRYLTA
ncbi:MAG TPA: hypothetical protein VFK85_06745 [Anaeromyxobacteraceae bacterium]|nr:hypothetical protein [Anaeromyxobacteraceae bacterium]